MPFKKKDKIGVMRNGRHTTFFQTKPNSGRTVLFSLYVFSCSNIASGTTTVFELKPRFSI